MRSTTPWGITPGQRIASGTFALDGESLEAAAKAIAILERAKLGVDRARVVLTLVDLRTKLGGEGLHLVDRLLDGLT